tara:strand:- start:1494 stop:1823 length:330 start_codon:yes stop_codon:yes gene_type:complete
MNSFEAGKALSILVERIESAYPCHDDITGDISLHVVWIDKGVKRFKTLEEVENWCNRCPESTVCGECGNLFYFDGGARRKMTSDCEGCKEDSPVYCNECYDFTACGLCG